MGRYNIPLIDATNPVVLIADLQNIVDDIDDRLSELEGGGENPIVDRIETLEEDMRYVKPKAHTHVRVSRKTYARGQCQD